MSPAELAAIRERLSRATPRPWYAAVATTAEGAATHVVSLDHDGDLDHGRNVAAGLSGADAAMMAAAPDDLAALLAEVERLRSVARGRAVPRVVRP